MEHRTTVDVSTLPRLHYGQESLVWWGVVGLLLIEACVVSVFITTYFYLGVMTPEWPPLGVSSPDSGSATLSLGLQLLSCVTMWIAGRQIDRNQSNGFIIAISASIALTVVVLALRGFQMAAFDFRWDEHAYGSTVWTITGFQVLHILAAGLAATVLGILGSVGFLSRERQLSYVVVKMYWYFVALSGVPVYIVLYWFPRLM